MGTKAPEAGILHHNSEKRDPEPPVEPGPARHLRVVREVLTRSVYLQSAPDPVFAMTHVPSTIADDATGVVLCPPFGWADICTYRTRRVWADTLARAGHPAVRIDLPGTGDSGGSPRDPQRLAAWTGAVAAAASWLRDEGGCRRVVGMGIGFGGMLAWLAASEGAQIDDLALWAVPTLGRRLLREMRASAMIEINTDTELEDAAGTEPQDARAVPGDDGLLDMAGRMMTKETVDSLAGLDLTTLRLADPTQRRVLLFEGDGVAPDQRLHDYFEASGAEVTVASGEGYGAMMRYARYAQTPAAAIAQSISWLSNSDIPGRRPSSSPVDTPAAPVDALPTLELWHDGVAIRETPLIIESDSGSMFGILAEPAGAASADVCAVLFNAGSDRRTGPNRAWVETARRWAAQGVPTVRFDQPGVGDSDGEERDYDDIGAYYNPRITSRTITILDALEARGLPGRFALVGFCAGGYWALHAALADERVAGAFAINLPCFYWTWWTRHVLHGRWVHRKPRPDDSRMVATALWALSRVSRVLPLARRALFGVVGRGPRRLNRSMNQLSDRGTQVLLMFRPSEPLYQEMLGDGGVDRLGVLPNVDVQRIPGADHTFRPLPLQRYVSDELDKGLRRVLRTGASSGTRRA
jgi:pimeloyl-ACP methyl ester carboxylesterase